MTAFVGVLKQVAVSKDLERKEKQKEMRFICATSKLLIRKHPNKLMSNLVGSTQSSPTYVTPDNKVS